jgi:hypothetical protein
MKNFILLIFVALFVVSCTKKDSEVTLSQNYFKINSDRYDLDKAYYTIDSINKFTEIAIVSNGLTYDASIQEFKGKGNAIYFDFGDLSSVLKAGSYYTPRGFFGGITLDYSYNLQSVTEYEMKETLPGKLLITNTNSNYNIQFEFTLEGGQVVTGQYTGTVKKERF